MSILTRLFTLLVVVGLVLSALPGEDAAALPAAANPTATPRPASSQSAGVRPAAAAAPYIAGTVWDDTRIRNGTLDDNELGLASVTVTFESLDTPGLVFACAGSTTPTAVTDANGRYRCDGLVAGLYRVSITIPTEYEATTPRQREVSATIDGGIANFGVGHLDPRIRVIGGIVFLDCNENGIQDLPVEFDDRPPNGSFNIRLERIDGTNSRSPTSTRNNRYSFDDLDSGTYVVTLTISDNNLKATTGTRREVTIGTTFGAVVDFGVLDFGQNSRCARSAAATATRVEATAVTAANATATAIVASGGNNVGPGQSIPPAAATAISQRATATAARFTPTPIPTPSPTATPLATTRLTLAYPRSARFLMQAVAKLPNGQRIDMLAEGALIGLETIVFQDAGQRVGSEQISMRIKRNERVDDVVVTAQDAYRQGSGDAAWRKVAYDEVRNDLGLLAPLDAIVALRCISRGQDGGQAIVNGAVTRYVLGEVDALRFWETSVRPHFAGDTGGGSSSGGGAPTVAGSAYRSATGRIIPGCTPPAQGPSDMQTYGAQPVYQSMQVEAWVGIDDGLIRSERMTAKVLPAISDPKQMPDPIDLDVVLTYSDVNKPITIIAPQLPPPPPTAAPATGAQGAPGPGGQPSGLTGGPGATVQPAPPNGLSGTPAPTPGLPGLATPGVGTPEVPPEGAPEQPAGPPPSQREQALAAERALVAIATGGQPRTGSYARGSSILLDLPFRSQQDNTAYQSTNSGAASMAMVLAGYGTEVSVPDLRALLNGLDGNYSPGASPRVETMARVAERGGMNVLDLYRGARFNEWTVEQVREMIRRGYPVVTLIQGAVLPGGTPPGVARERYITIIGIDGDDIIYHDPGYPDEGQGAARRIPARILEQGWLAASTPRLAAGFSLGPEARGMLDSARGEVPGTAVAQGSPTPNLQATVPVIATLEPTPTVAPPEYPFGLPVHPLLVLFWLVLVVLLLVILVRSLR
ncbi:MAG: SdrD B-like domain-containing protein [Chloroflexota bacterium]